MVIYFTGTGNSKYAAGRIAKGIGEEACDLFSKIRDHENIRSYIPKRRGSLSRRPMPGESRAF